MSQRDNALKRAFQMLAETLIRLAGGDVQAYRTHMKEYEKLSEEEKDQRMRENLATLQARLAERQKARKDSPCSTSTTQSKK